MSGFNDKPPTARPMLARLASGMGAVLRGLGSEPTAKPVKLSEAEQSAAERVLNGARVLLVDDHVVNRRAMALMLQMQGVVATSAASAEEALDMLAAQPFDVVLMDVYMPDMDGREATRRLRASRGVNRNIPVIAVTASATPKDWAACREAGMTGHVAKPVDAAALLDALLVALAAGKIIHTNAVNAA
jgi:CheY-like chemotaxis protein